MSTQGALREAIMQSGGTVGTGSVLAYVPPPISAPFGSSEPVEDVSLRCIDVRGAAAPPGGTAFLDGIQRFRVAGRIGIVPIVRGVAAAAVMERRDGTLAARLLEKEECLVASLGRLEPTAVARLESLGLPLYDSTDGDRSHPLLDIQLAGRLVERRREALERRVAEQWLATRSAGWLLIDGSITALPGLETSPAVLGVIKSHETQFLDGADLVTALTLPPGHRSSVFCRESSVRSRVYSWYLRLWPWEERDLLHGLLRLECAPDAAALGQATEISRWLLAERAPLSAPDGRWDRLLYPVQHVEAYLRAQIGERL